MTNRHSDTQIAFVDGTAPDVRDLAHRLPANVEPILLTGGDPLGDIAQALTARPAARTVHVFGHGGAGRIALGGADIDAEALEGRADALTEIGNRLENGEILLYGCSVGAGPEGAAFVRRLSDLTGAGVAAAEGPVGAEARGGSWTLPVTAGTVLSRTIEVPGFEGVLGSGVPESGILQNRFVRVGYSEDGTLGVGGGTKPGIQYDPEGTRKFLDTADSLTPGSPFEGFSVKVGDTVHTENNSDGGSATHGTAILGTDLKTVGEDTFGSVSFVTLLGDLRVEQTFTLGSADAKVIVMDVEIENLGDAAVEDVSYARFTDPDVDSNGLPGATSSTDNAIGAEGIDGSDIVLATGPVSGRVVGLYSNSAVPHAAAVSSMWSTDPATYLAAENTGPSADAVIGIGFDLGDFAAGESKSFSLAYVFAASAAELGASVAEAAPPNAAPTLDAIGTVETVAEGEEVEITFAEIAAKANAADSDGTVDAFVVTAVTSGTLRIGESAATATAWSVGANDGISASLNAYWTPDAGASGLTTPFSVVALDDAGAVSEAAVGVPVAVTAADGPEDGEGARGRSGEDVLIGRGGPDRLIGGPSDDVLRGKQGADLLFGGDDADWIFGGRGKDRLYGGDDEDRLMGRLGDDALFGGGGADRLAGGFGEDRLFGGDGGDVLHGKEGSDRLHGGAGDDRLFGGLKDDRLHGGDGADRLVGGAGRDRLTGGDGADVFVFVGGHDLIRDFEAGEDRISLRRDDGIESMRDLRAAAEQHGEDVVIDAGGGILILHGVDLEDLGRHDFLF